MLVKALFEFLQTKKVKEHEYNQSEVHGSGDRVGKMSSNWWKCLADQLLVYGKFCLG